MADYKLNIRPDFNPPTLAISQGDIGRIISVFLYDKCHEGYDIPAGASVELVGIKPSGLGFTVTGTWTESTATFVTTEEMSDEAGGFLCEVRIKSGQNVIGSSNAWLYVEQNPHPDGTTDGTGPEIISEITLLVREAETASENALGYATRAEAAAVRAETAEAKITDVVAEAETLPPGSDATANYIDGILYQKATRAIRALKATRAIKATKAIPVYKDQKATPARQGRKVQQGQQDRKAKRAKRERLAHKVRKVKQDRKGQKVTRAIRVRQDHKDRKANRGRQDRMQS